MVATDLASRGLDVRNCAVVVNYDVAGLSRKRMLLLLLYYIILIYINYTI